MVGGEHDQHDTRDAENKDGDIEGMIQAPGQECPEKKRENPDGVKRRAGQSEPSRNLCSDLLSLFCHLAEPRTFCVAGQ
ncbi:MAG: hypothetical protein A2X95_01185 [Syntrophobacterales bacterium GWF2_56_9]|nr:MAG: hypothetical protein A2X95_01185 [Syntrophobacterales bacterium GWF2_56_9]